MAHRRRQLRNIVVFPMTLCLAVLATANAGHGVRAAAEPQTVTVAYNATG